jgi:hypothetical protein
MGEFDRPSWAQRKFAFVHPPWMLADFVERLRGVLPRLDALLVGVDDSRARVQVDGKWSIAQNIGHLSDVEELWQERLEDLKHGRKTYTPAVGSRFQELAKRHQEPSVAETLGEFKARRSRLVDALAQASPDLQKSLIHQRNANWSKWIERRMTEPGAVMIAVGAGHLAGKDSVLEMLKKGGYKIRRLQ